MAKTTRSAQSKPSKAEPPKAKPRKAPTTKARPGPASAKSAVSQVRAKAEPVRAGWATELVFNVREPKLAVSLRLDADVLRFFRGFGSGYQTRINEVLKAFMHARGEAETIGHAVASAKSGRTSGGNGKPASR